MHIAFNLDVLSFILRQIYLILLCYLNLGNVQVKQRIIGSTLLDNSTLERLTVSAKLNILHRGLSDTKVLI